MNSIEILKLGMGARLTKSQAEEVSNELAKLQQRITELEVQLKELREVTPRMLKAAQIGSELGVIATSKYAGAYGIMTEMYQVMFDAAIKEKDHE